VSSKLQAKTETDSHQVEIIDQDSSGVDSLLSRYEALKDDNREEAVLLLKQSLQLARATGYKRGELESLIQYGEYLESFGKQDSALLFYKNAEEIAISLNEKKAQSRVLVGQGMSLTYLQRLEEADSVTQAAIEIAKQDPIDSITLAKAYTNLSNIAFYSDQYDASIAYDQQSLAYNTQSLKMRARSLLNIGSTHFRLALHKKADEYFLKALEAANEADDQDMMALAHLELGRLRAEQEMYNEAKSYYKLALEQFRRSNAVGRIASIQHNIAIIDLSQKRYDEAIAGFRSALELMEDIDSPYNQAATLYQLGITYFEKQEFSHAESYLLKANGIYDTMGNLNMQRWTALRLSDLYAATNNYKKAYQFLQVVKTKDDSLFSLNQSERFQEIEEKYQNEQKQREIELLNAENQVAQLEIEKQTNLRNYLILAAILLALLIGVVYNRYKLNARANARLKELDTLKTKFFTNISHEFRTPLTLIKGPIELAEESPEKPMPLENIKMVRRNANRLLKLVNQLLDLSKIDAGGLNLEPSEGNIFKCLRAAASSFSSHAAQRNMDYQIKIPSRSLWASFDRDKLEKVAYNLLSNAFKFTPDNETVVFSAIYDSGRLQMEVKDTGQGIPAKGLHKIFDRFYQVDDSFTREKEGTGVGLALTKELIELMEGVIFVESEVDQGTLFKVIIPLEEILTSQQDIDTDTLYAEDDLEVLERSALQEQSESEKSILIIEDNVDMRHFIRQQLVDEYRIIEASEGQTGLEKAKNHTPDLIITDLMMPQIDGMTLCKELKLNIHTSHIPIIMLTAKAGIENKIEGLETGADDYLTKPFNTLELQVRVKNLMQQRDKLKELFTKSGFVHPKEVTVNSMDEQFLQRVLDLFEEKYADPDFGTSDMQESLAMSKAQLHRKFKAITSQTPGELLRNFRLKRAAQILKQDGENVTQVAYAVGFNNLSYFAKCFKSLFGVTPSVYAKKEHSEGL
jgi:signal transduction histidine kinase/DNA-binding response OmpR family regulator